MLTSSTKVFTWAALSVIARITWATCWSLAPPSLDLEMESSINAAVSLAAWAERCARLRTSSRHHRKPHACLARARRFDGGVQRQNIGLERDFVDDLDDLGNLVARGCDFGHRSDHLVEGAVAVSDPLMELGH